VSNQLNIGGDSYGPNAVGRGARAHQEHVTIGRVGDNRLSGALGNLRGLLEKHRAEIPEASRVDKDVDAVEQEINDPDPDPDRLRDTLRRIAGRVATVAPVLGAVNDLREIVEDLLR
jgi:Family of unknown function (DUF5955)